MSQAEELLDSLDETIPTHQHDVIDSDSYFIIDPITRAVENTSGSKNLLMQYDHASERYTFELPRYVEGHDMSLCTAVKVHYNNIESGTLIENADVNDLDDLHVDPTDANKVICSWLIKRQATQLVGSLNFLVQYLCATSDGTITYEWHSDIYKNIEIREGRNNGPAAVSDYTDILEQWRAKLFGVEDSITASILALLEDFSADVLKKDNTEEYTPTENYHPSTKKYVDDNISKLSEEIANLKGLEPNEDDIPKVFFSDTLPQTKDDTAMSFRYISKTMDISGYCKTKAQGNSSMSYPKKNQTVKLYKDIECTEKLKVDFYGWGKQNKFCFKANWVDLTHSRNIVSARLWGDVVKSRSDYDTLPEELRTSPNLGAVNGFPVKVYAGGIYQGRYTLNIPKGAWMANMDDGLDEHCILCGENYKSGCFRAEAIIDGSDWSDEIHDNVPDSIKTRWNECINFVMNSTDNEFVSGISDYFDLQSLIDYYCFGVVICNNDGFGKNQLFLTYDGLKWYANVYDLDNSFGTYLGYVLDYSFPRNSFEDFKSSYEEREGNLLYIRLESLFVDDIKKRYAELKNGALSFENIINRFERFTDICSLELVKEDYAETTANGAFTEIPLQEESNIQQIRDYIVNRYHYIDSYIENLGSNGTLLYSLAEETTFDGVDDYIDTGVTLFNETKDFTIVVDVTDGENNTSSSKVFSCRKDADNDNGVYIGGLAIRHATSKNLIVTSSPVDESLNGDSWWFSNIIPCDSRLKMAITFLGGIAATCAYKTINSDAITTQTAISGKSYRQHNNTIILGASNVGSADTVGEFWNGTIHSFEVYNYAMSTDEISKKFTE